mmetsp:Transcript_25993/g.51838  ORF Transcript_25993/g.51838 Transcript_25993/m.51838 type:complete len:134 (+) Transcript_25993:153-554(+)
MLPLLFILMMLPLLSSSLTLYPPIETLLLYGPVPTISRLSDPSGYITKINEYKAQNKKASCRTAQGNVDAFLAAPDVWAEQKLLEGKGKRGFYDYGRELEGEKVVLSVLWSVIVVGVGGRAAFVAATGGGNLF